MLTLLYTSGGAAQARKRALDSYVTQAAPGVGLWRGLPEVGLLFVIATAAAAFVLAGAAWYARRRVRR